MNLKELFFEHRQKILELFLYVFFGVVGTIVNILIFVVLTKCFSVHYLLSNFIAWIFSIIFAFVTNKIWVFKSKSWSFSFWFKEFINFLIARIATCIFDFGYMFLSISFFHFDEAVSKIIANFIVVVANYILSKLWIFKNLKDLR